MQNRRKFIQQASTSFALFPLLYGFGSRRDASQISNHFFLGLSPSSGKSTVIGFVQKKAEEVAISSTIYEEHSLNNTSNNSLNLIECQTTLNDVAENTNHYLNSVSNITLIIDCRQLENIFSLNDIASKMPSTFFNKIEAIIFNKFPYSISDEISQFLINQTKIYCQTDSIYLIPYYSTASMEKNNGLFENMEICLNRYIQKIFR